MNDIYDRLRKPSGGLPHKKPVQAVPPRSKPIAKTPVESLWASHVKPQNTVRPKRKAKRKLVLIASLLILIVVGSIAGAMYMRDRNLRTRNQPAGKPAPAEKPRNQDAQATGPIRLVATGDMIPLDAINKNALKADGSYDYLPMMEKMKPFFEKADIRFCNQATPAGGAGFGISGYPIFNAPLEFPRDMQRAGCNLVTIGSNHTNDKGQALLEASVAAWDNKPDILAVAGANRSVEEQKKPRTFTVKGMKFAFLAYTTYVNTGTPALTPHGLNIYSSNSSPAEIAEVRKNADFVILSMRWGTEYSSEVNPEQDRIAQEVVNAGADVVLGHGPHDIQPVKRLVSADGREVPVWFSLGNFLNSQLDISNLIGLFAVMDIDPTTKKIIKLGNLPIYQHYEWTAEQAVRRNNTDLLARHSFQLVPLDQAADLLPKSHHNTNVQAQTDRVNNLLNKFTEVPLIKSSEY